jgi:hypothetical protein
VEGTLDFHGLLPYHCLSFHGTGSPYTQISTLEFGLIRPPQGEWVTVLLQEIFWYDSSPYNIDFGARIH